MYRLLCLLLLSLVAVNVPVAAQDVRTVCQTYARDAVSFQQQNVELGCELTGPEWNADFNYHYDWCVNGNNYKAATQWTKFRRSKIAQCREVRSGPAQPPRSKQVAKICERYAAEAVAQQKSNLQSACGLRGAEWNADYRYHYDWCVNGKNAETASHWTGWRKEKLSACVAAAPAPKTEAEAWRNRMPRLVDAIMNRLNQRMASIEASLSGTGVRKLKYTPLDMNAVIAAAKTMSGTEQYRAFERKQSTLLQSAAKAEKKLRIPPSVSSVVAAPIGALIEPGSAVLVTGSNFGARPGKLYISYQEDKVEFESPKLQRVELLPFRADWPASWFGNLIVAKVPETLPGRMRLKGQRDGELHVAAADGTQTKLAVRIGSGQPVITSMESPAGNKVIVPGQQFYLIGRNFGADRGKILLTLGGGRKKQWLAIRGKTSYVLSPIAGADPENNLPAPDIGLRIDDWSDNLIRVTAAKLPAGTYIEASYGALSVENRRGHQAILNRVTFNPGNVVVIISGKKWWDRRNSGTITHNKSAMVVTHVPDCGTYSGEKGFDTLMGDIPFPHDIELFRVDFRQIDPEHPYDDLDFFVDQVGDLVNAVLSGPFGIAEYIAGKVLAAILSSAGGYHAVVTSLPGRNNARGVAVRWETACVLDGKPIVYAISFSISGRPEAVAKHQ